MNTQGVIFDFNGTLFWDTGIHNHAWDIFLERKNIRLSDQEKNAKIHGKNNTDIFTTLFPQTLSEEEIQALSREKETIYQSLCLKSPMQLAPGAHDFLTFLTTHQIPFAIATASDRYNVDFYFEHLELHAFFDRSHVIFNDGAITGKPAPHIFQSAMKTLGVTGEDTLIFEDSLAGIMAAERAQAAKIIIVNSNNDEYPQWSYQQITDFKDVDRHLFDQ